MKKLPVLKYLPYFGAFVSAVLFSLAGNKFFGSYGWLAGFGVGAVVSYSMAVATSRYADIPEKRKAPAKVLMILTVIFSISTITLSWKFPDTTWAIIAWAADVDLAIATAGFVAGKSLIPAQQPAKNRSAKASGKRAKGSGRSADFECPYKSYGCTVAKHTQNAINAHAGKCHFNPAGNFLSKVASEVQIVPTKGKK